MVRLTMIIAIMMTIIGCEKREIDGPVSKGHGDSTYQSGYLDSTISVRYEAYSASGAFNSVTYLKNSTPYTHQAIRRDSFVYQFQTNRRQQLQIDIKTQHAGIVKIYVNDSLYRHSTRVDSSGTFELQASYDFNQIR